MAQITYEYLIPSEILIVDPDAWEPLQVTVWDRPAFIDKPISGGVAPRIPESTGGEFLDVRYSVFRVRVPNGEDPDFNWNVPLSALQLALAWIRVVSGQYWVGVAPSGSWNVRGSRTIEEDAEHRTVGNFGGYRSPIPARPLTREQWTYVGEQLSRNRTPSASQVMFSDALLRFLNLDFTQTIVGLGIACELELENFIDRLLSIQGETVRQLYRAVERTGFEWRFTKVMALLGTQDFRQTRARAARNVLEVYRLRGEALHRGACQVERNGMFRAPDFADVTGYIFGTGEFLEWTAAEARRLGVPEP